MSNPRAVFSLSMLKGKMYTNNFGIDDYFKESIQNDNVLLWWYNF